MYKMSFKVLVGVCLAAMVAAPAAAQSQSKMSLGCSGEAGNFTVVIAPDNGPVNVFQNGELWHRFIDHYEDETIIKSMQVVVKENNKQRFKGVTLDRLTGEGKMSEWTNSIKFNAFGGVRNKKEVHSEIIGSCAKVAAPKIKQQF